MTKIARLPARGVIEVAGEDRVAFLQGLVSNDVTAVRDGTAVWAALLTPQGKFLAEFFILADAERLLLDCERAQVTMLVQRLNRFRLRAKATIRDLDRLLHVYAAWDGTPDRPAGTIAAPDPRLPAAGWRILSQSPIAAAVLDDQGWNAWDRHRIALGLPDGTRDLEPEKTVLLEAGFDELHGVSWTKGCYMGQELTARTRYRGLVKRRLVPVAVDGPLPAPGTPVLRAHAEVGVMRSGQDDSGLALLRLEALEGPLTCGESTLSVRVPSWMRLPQSVG
jgi:tRNA-modifying protein YgfZ